MAQKKEKTEQVNISGFPEPLLNEVDVYAKRQRRSRSAQIIDFAEKGLMRAKEDKNKKNEQ